MRFKRKQLEEKTGLWLCAGLACTLFMVLVALAGCALWRQVFPNDPPVAAAGVDQTATVGNVVDLDGGASSDPEGDKLSYTWFFWDAPVGSSTMLFDYTSSRPYFTPDVAGAYVFILIVSDSYADSKPDAVTITANP